MYNKSWQIYVITVTIYTKLKKKQKQLKTKFDRLKYSLWAKFFAKHIFEGVSL